MAERRRYGSATEWEDVVGYSRAVRVGRHVHVSGTTATDEAGRLVGVGDPYRQAVQALSNIRAALRSLGAELEHVVRTRLYVTDIDDWQAIGRAHGEFLGEVRPAATLVEVSRLVDERMLVEIEADAILPSEEGEVNSE
ncbi:MAG: RidA family protein [Acidobacteriota bacterium]|nr:MAG: RidA family protein [Acidobacteriota bacterium]